MFSMSCISTVVFFITAIFGQTTLQNFYKPHRKMKIFLSLNEQEYTDESGPYQKKELWPPKKNHFHKTSWNEINQKKRKLCWVIKKIYFIIKKQRICFYLACGETFMKFATQKNLPGWKKHFISNEAATPRSTTKTTPYDFYAFFGFARNGRPRLLLFGPTLF